METVTTQRKEKQQKENTATSAAQASDQRNTGAREGMPLFLQPNQASREYGSEPPADSSTTSQQRQSTKPTKTSASNSCETEADQLAEDLVTHNKSVRVSAAAPAVSRKAKNTHSSFKQPQAAEGTGRPLPTEYQTFFESKFDENFDTVKIHDDENAAKQAEKLNAYAFTQGNHIVFGNNQFSPNTSKGKRLLAHELTHVVQQKNSGNQSIQCNGIPEEDRPTTQERSTIDEIREILGYTWVGPLDEYDLQAKWASFGSRLPQMAQQHYGLWTSSIAHGAELEDLSGVTLMKNRFGSDVRRKALGYIQENRLVVESELRNLGIDPSGGTGSASATATPQIASDADARARTQELRDIAELVKRAQTAQTLLTNIEVGYALSPEARPGVISILAGQGDEQEHARDLVGRSGRRHLMPTGFSPFRPPAHPPFGDEEPVMTAYDEVKKQYDDVTAVIEGYSTRYPSIYAVLQNNNIDELVTAASPTDARQTIVDDLNQTLSNMDNAAAMISSGDLDYHDLNPVHDQLKAGQVGASGTNWSQSFPAWVVAEDMRGHRSREIWITLGLGSLAAAGFIFMNIATFGTATFFVAAAVGVGASGAIAARSWEHYDDLSTAAGAEMSAETRIVRSGQASQSLVRAIIDTVFFFLTAKGAWNAARAARMASGASRVLPAPAAAGSLAMNTARSSVIRRIEVLRARIASILGRRGPRDTIVETSRRELEQVHSVAVTNATNIRQGTGSISSELQVLSQAERNTLADQLLREVGQEYRGALRTLERAELMVPRAVPPNPAAGHGARGLGSPPARSPPPYRGGEGWENW